jgi:PAS domain S-box-containing protein
MGIEKDKSLLTTAAELRRLVQKRLHTKTGGLPPLRTEETKQRLVHELGLVHELEVHQVEMGVENEELRRAQEELELSRDRYAALYDFAPAGYFTIDTSGLIREVNLHGAELLGIERDLLAEKPFTTFIADAVGRDVFSDHLESVLHSQEIQRCEIRLTGKNGIAIHTQLQSVAVDAVDSKDGYFLCSIVDVTVAKQLGDELQNAHDKLELAVSERTSELTERTEELTSSNVQLTQEIEEHKKTEQSLQDSYAEIIELKDRLQAENLYLAEEVARKYNFGEIIGQSTVLSNVFSLVEQVAPMNATVLLLGETGTGKGVVARTIHSRSSRKARPLITVNCTTLPATLVESELFGRERGAFTGSDARQIGRFELADGGTIFLDEIGEMPMELQSKLLRVIQDGEFERLGSPRTIKVDVRIIAATNRNLEEEIKNGRFREDLYYRLNVFPITMPTLRQRTDDIPLLVNHFVTKFNHKIGKMIDTVSKDTLNILQGYHWPGNVRELESVIERAVIVSQGSALQVLDRFDSLPKSAELLTGQSVKTLVETEHDHILQVLQQTGWRIEGRNGAAGLLGLNASTLRARMRKYGIIRK